MTHIVHFLSLLTFYLGVKMPFEVVWSGGRLDAASSSGKLGVGQPMIGAIRGGESGGWARWYTKHSLHVSANPTSPTVGSSPAAGWSSTVGSGGSNPQSPPPTESAMADSIYESTTPPVASSSFTTALTMLLYNVVYLAHTQNVAVPLNQAGDVLSNLWSICCSVDLGKCVYAL